MTSPDRSRQGLLPLSLLLLPLAFLLWSYLPTLAEIEGKWSSNPQYSHGYLVPGFALLLLWLRREKLDLSAWQPSAWGFVFLGAGLVLRLAGTYYHYLSLDQVSFLPCLIGLVFLAGGWSAWRWAWPALLFLAFMFPLPHTAEHALAAPLQRLATVASTFLMQVMGLPALAEGNIILLNDAEIGVVEACSGLRMLMVFIALATAVVLVSKRPVLDKVFLLASAIPIALVANIIRITATGTLHELVDGETAQVFFHDVAGWLMMPLALAFLGLELLILSRLFIDGPGVVRRTPSPVVPRRPGVAAAPKQAAPAARQGRPTRTPYRKPEPVPQQDGQS